MARYGRDHRGGGNESFDWYRGRGMPGSWTHWGPGHGRGGGIEGDDLWRANRDEYRRGEVIGSMRSGGRGRSRDGYGGDYRRSDRAGGRPFWRGGGFRGGYGGDYRRGGYDRGW